MDSAREPARANAPVFLLGAVVILWGTAYWPTAVAAEDSPPLLVGALRIATGILPILIAAIVMRGKLPRGRMLLWAIFTGLLMVALFYWGITEAIARAGAGNSAIVVNTNPLIVLVLAWIFLRERLSMLAVFGLALGFGGVVLMVSTQLGGDVETSQLLIGIGLSLLAAAGWAVGVLILRHLSQRPGGVEMMGFTTVQFVASAAVLAPVAFAIEGTSSTDWGSGTFWAAMIWIGPAASVGVAFFYMTLRYLSAAKTSSTLFLVPAVAVIVEIARGEAPSAIVLAGMLVTVIGVALAVMPRETLASLIPRLRRQSGAN
jgi:drug/metabolite transporter (DMT)-like permease